MTVIHNISVMIHIISVMRETETQLAGTVTVTMSRHRWATMWMRVAETVIVCGCRKVV